MSDRRPSHEEEEEEEEEQDGDGVKVRRHLPSVTAFSPSKFNRLQPKAH